MRYNSIIFKALLLVSALACAVFAKAQDPCEITCNVEMPICSGTEIVLSVPNNYQCTYQWNLNGSPLSGQTNNSLRVRPKRPAGDNGTSILEMRYNVTIRDLDTDTVVCQSEPFIVGVRPIFKMKKYNQVKLTCSNRDEENGHTAQVIAEVDSTSAAYAPPFTYQWEVSPLHIAPTDPSWAIGLEAFKYYYIKVTDARGCMQRDSVSLKAYLNPRIEISTDPSDTVYIQNPHVSYSFENQPFSYKGEDDLTPKDTLINVSNFYWILNSTYNLTSTELEPRFTYVETGDFTTELKVYNPQGCDTSYYKTIKVEPVKLKIPNVFTPNGDGVNDYFIISLDNGGSTPSGGDTRDDGDGNVLEYENYDPLSRYYESSELTIFNRWGRIVYHSKDYHNDWDGDNLSDGTYFYVLKCHGLKQDATYQGSIMIIKSQR